MARGTAYEACLSEIKRASGIDMTDTEAEGMLDQVLRRAERIRAERAVAGGDAAAIAAQELAGEKTAAARANRLDALRNATIRATVLDRVRTEGGIIRAADVLHSIMHWVPGAARLDSIEGTWHALSKQWQSVLGNRLRQAGLEKAAISGQLDHEVAEALWRANGGAPNELLALSKPAQTIADAIKPLLDLARNRMNSVGGRIGNAVDYVTHTNWDPRQLRRAGGLGATRDQAFEAWWAKERPRMAESTFDHLEPAEGESQAAAERRFGRSVFDATSSGIHMQGPALAGMADNGAGYIPPAFEGTRNIARGVSQPRVIHWKDAGSWVDHMREFGGGDSLYAQVMRTLDGSARKTGLMSKLGTNPAGNLNLIIRRIQEEGRTDLEGLNRFNNAVDGLHNVMGRLDGTLNIPVNADRAQRLEHLMTLEATAHLGGVSVTHIAAAPATVTAELAHHGVGHIEGIGRVLQAIVTGRGSAERQEILADAGAYAHGYNLGIAGKWKPDAGFPGFVSWAATNFMRLTGLGHFLDQFQASGVKSVLMTKLGRAADLAFGALDQQQASLLGRYGINEGEWDLLRTAGDPLNVEGQRYITPADAARTAPAKVEALLRQRGVIAEKAAPEVVARAVQQFQWELGDRYLMYLNDASEHATVTPGVRERAMVMGSERPGSIGYSVRRFTVQFKLWPLAAMNQILGREIGYTLAAKGMDTQPGFWRGAGQLAVNPNVYWLLALSTAGGALRMSVNDLAIGNPQRNYLHPNTLLAALAQGGGLGIYGDFLFGETSRMGAGLIATAGGPVIGDADRLIKIYERFRADVQDHPDKALQHMWPDLAHLAVGHIPFANLIYLKGALDYMLWYHLYEAASPGWWQRTNRRLEKERGRTMVGYTPGGSVPYGLPGIYLQRGGQSMGLLGGAR
jgi:hypothetical protein